MHQLLIQHALTQSVFCRSFCILLLDQFCLIVCYCSGHATFRSPPPSPLGHTHIMATHVPPSHLYMRTSNSYLKRRADGQSSKAGEGHEDMRVYVTRWHLENQLHQPGDTRKEVYAAYACRLQLLPKCLQSTCNRIPPLLCPKEERRYKSSTPSAYQLSFKESE